MKNLLLLLIFFFIFFQIPAFGQNTTANQKIDSLLTSIKDSLIILDPDLSGTNSDTLYITPSLEVLIRKGRKYTLLANEIMLELQESLDTTRFVNEIPNMNETLASIRDRIRTANTKFNFRYVNALFRLLETTEETNMDLDKIIEARLDRLQILDSLMTMVKNDDFFKYKIRDTLLLPMYSGEIQNLKENIYRIDSTIYRQELQAARYQSDISRISMGITELKRYVTINKSILERNLFKKEINYIWESYSIPSPKSILDITSDSIQLNFLILKKELMANPIISYLALLILIAASIGIRRVVKSIEKDKEYGKIILNRLKYLDVNPISSVLVGLLPLVFFMFDTGSIALLTFFIYMQVLFSSVLIHSSFPKPTFLRWMVLVVIFVFFTISNLYWEIAYQERVYFQIGNIVIIYILWKIPENFSSDDPKELNFLKNSRVLIMILLTFGILANLLGRYSLAKILSVAGSVGFVHAITLYFFVKVIMEIIYVLLENKKESDSFTSFIDFTSIQKRIRGVLLFLGFVFWIFILLQNLALSDYVFETLEKFLVTERFLGETSFTFRSIFLFGALIYVAYLLSNNIAYFVTIKDQQKPSTRKKRLGSSVLLIRLAILIAGFIIATTAANIPLNNITIVLGALSVGIGFGLQTIINNLVSGVILAFERPIQIGDDIEVGAMTGKVKEVGIRASKIQGYDGSEIIVPNGDLLSQQLINWTLSDKRRRVELLIGVAYNSDMTLVQSLIKDALEIDKISKDPAPKVLMQTFGDNSVDFRVLFWVDDMDIWLDMRHEVMSSFYASFKKNGIEIPFPQRDINFKNILELKIDEETGSNRIEKTKKSPDQ
ncbi:Small-conductance mechanosensitive channel [Algoriphagus alkaliphilus]|uniref:Small-conductance mechanosensitive channel n=1 Tax=Algoriphagus alkaliphilus TaxID=279824 RepID=A0A1G5VVT6_9BACT|nr:mechanosensitive ion channel domain-containing protein [Algoriphagus alkaliphilus]SDA49125.1 Small-conductance mechanosensitive channel [Algoriphagus alkaliphilus]